SARELIARVETQLKLAHLRVRAEAERERFYAPLQQAPIPIVVYEGPELRIAYQNQASLAITGGDHVLGKAFLEAFPNLRDSIFYTSLRQVYETGEGSAGPPVPIPLPTPSG